MCRVREWYSEVFDRGARGASGGVAAGGGAARAQRGEERDARRERARAPAAAAPRRRRRAAPARLLRHGPARTPLPSAAARVPLPSHRNYFNTLLFLRVIYHTHL